MKHENDWRTSKNIDANISIRNWFLILSLTTIKHNPQSYVTICDIHRVHLYIRCTLDYYRCMYVYIYIYWPQHRQIEIWTPVNCMAHTTSITRSQKTCKEARNSCTSNRPSIDCLICAVFIQQWYKDSKCHRAHIFCKIPSWPGNFPWFPFFLLSLAMVCWLHGLVSLCTVGSL